MEDALDFNGNTGPYAQYTYARTCSVLNKLSDEANVSVPKVSLTLEKAERDLSKSLSLFPEKISEAINAMEPSTVTR